MSWLRNLEISASGLTAERLRMDVIAGNIANAQTTRSADGGPYRRRGVVLAEREPARFAALLAGEMHGGGGADLAGLLAGGMDAAGLRVSGGVRAEGIAPDSRPFKLKYDPGHPDADANGYVQLPNVDVVMEMTDLITASRSYEANVTALNAFKAMVSRALEIGR